MNNSPERQAHAVLDLESRKLKALKIERLLDLKPCNTRLKILEIGCGSGGISHYFATHPSIACEVTAVDVQDNRRVHGNYKYIDVHSIELPFDNSYFDIVITNHVIEHVGDKPEQLGHLKEIHRVLKEDGKGYLAVPNRWMVIEPHYRLAFLSWLPRVLRTPYLRVMGRGQLYDCEPLQLPELEEMLRQTRFKYQNLSVQAWRETFDIEHPEARATRWLRAMPDVALKPLRRIIPTLICRIEH